MLAASEPYFTRLQDTISDILHHTHSTSSGYFEATRKTPSDKGRKAYIVITSDRGLAGAYNHNVIKLTESQLLKSKNNELLFIGSAGLRYFKRFPQLALINEDQVYEAVEPTLYRARSIAEYVVDGYRKRELTEIHLVFTKMQNALTAETEILQLLPMTSDMFPIRNSVKKRSEGDYEELYDPSPREVLNQLVPNYVKGLIYGAMIEAYASEQNARMLAMDNATKNGKELIEKFSLLYNQLRQSAITTELSEVIGGAGALEEQL